MRSYQFSSKILARPFPSSFLKVKVLVAQSCPTTRLLCPWNSPGKNPGVGSHSLLQGIFPTDLGIEPRSPALQEDPLPSEPPEKPLSFCISFNWNCILSLRASQVLLVVKNPPADTRDTRDMGLIPGSGRSPGEGHGNPLQYSCLENPHGQRGLLGYSL